MLRLRYIIILLCIFSLQYLYGQANLSLIQGKYEELDSIQYLKGLDEAVFQSVVRDFGEPLENHIKQRKRCGRSAEYRNRRHRPLRSKTRRFRTYRCQPCL